MQNIIERGLLFLKYRHNRERARVISRALDFVASAKVSGDYFEFGVFRGTTFKYAYHAARVRHVPGMHFLAFDSFEGISEPSSKDSTSSMRKGDRACSREEFEKLLKKENVPLNSVTIIPGFFEETLVGTRRGETGRLIGNRSAAIVYIDCDLYEPTYAALSFMTDRLADGAVIIFDDWFLLKGNPLYGEPRAFREWLNKHPEFEATHFYNFSWHGSSYIVNRVSNPPTP